MVGLQSRAYDVQQNDGDDVLDLCDEWTRALANKNPKITAGKGPHIFPNIASPGLAISQNKRASIEENSSNKPSVGKRKFRTFVYSLIFATIVFVAWQAYRDDPTREMISGWGRSWRTWVSSLPRHKSAVGPDRAMARAQAAAVAQSGPTPAVADVSRELQQHLQAVMSDLAVVRRAVEQIASQQEQMAQDIATLQAAERNVSERVSALAPNAQPAAVQVPRKKTPKVVPRATVEKPSSVPLTVSPPALHHVHG